MMSDRWNRLAELFDAALQRQGGDRAAYLASACADDPELRREVERLLASHDQAGSFGEAPAFRFGVAPGEGTLSAGSRLGRYEILGFLATGGMGEVYRAHDPQLGREVAIKVLPPRGEITSDQLARFDREARAVGALNHPNILAVYDVGTTGEVPYVVYELLEGETLRALLARGPLPRGQALDLARQIVAGLKTAHGKGIVHRDLKPENLFVTTDGRLKILDFGLAKHHGTAATVGAAASSLTGDGLVVGTAGYMSPEQVRGRHTDVRSDVFAAGAVFYEMVTGQRAFHGDSPVETMNAVLTIEPRSAGLPAPFDRVVSRCLEKDLELRFRSIDEVEAALGAHHAPVAHDRIVLAVLPFENLSGDAEQEYFSDGLTDEMIAQLGRLNPQRLAVIARTSAMKYKSAHAPVDVIGRELGASFILEGSVRRSAERVRVSARLIQVSEQTQVWSDSYDREIGDVLDMQSALSRAIAGEIRVQLTPEAQGRLARGRTVAPGAYEAYLKGRYFWGRRSREALNTSVRYFKKALEIDPAHVESYAGLADAYLTQLDYNHLPPREAFVLANDALLEALRLDDALAEPHSSLGHLRLHQYDYRAAEEQFSRAIELNPGYGTAHYYYANLLAALGRFDEALAEAALAIEIDPLTPNTRLNRVFILYLARRYDEAIAGVHEALELDPGYTGPYYFLGLIYERQGKHAEAIEVLRGVGPSGSNRGLTVLAAIGFAAANAGRRAEALEALQQLEALATSAYLSSYDLALVHAALGHTDQACALLSKAYDEHSSFLPYLNVDARFDGLRGDARVQALVRRMKLAPRGAAPSTPTRILQATVLGAALALGAYLVVPRTGEPIAVGASERPTVAILAFDNPTGDADAAWLTSGVPDMLSIGLAQTAGLDVVSSRRTSEILRDAGQLVEADDRARAFDLVKRAGAGAVVDGAVYRTTDGFRVDVRIEDLASSRVLAAASVSGTDIFALADDLVGQLRTALRFGDQPAGRRIAEITTHSPEAFRLYTEGYAAVRGLRTNDARQALEAALRLDPGYALAHVALSEAFDKFGDQKRAAEHLRSALALVGRLSERDRLLVEAREAHFAGQTDRTVRALEAFVGRWPDEDTAWDLLVHAYGRDPLLKRRQLDVLNRWRKAVPGPGAGHMHNHFGYAYLDAGRLDDAIASFESYVRVSPQEPNSYDSLAEALMIAARPAEALHSYDKASSINPSFGSALAGRAWALAMDGRLDESLDAIARLEDLGERGGVGWRHVHTIRTVLTSRAGRYREAAATIQRGLVLARRLQSTGLEAELHLGAAVIALETKQLARARAAATELIALLDRNRAVSEPLLDPPVLRSLAHLVTGLADVQANRLDRAGGELDAIRGEDQVDPLQVWAQHALAAEIAFARGDLDGAERLWRTGFATQKLFFSMRQATTMYAGQLLQRDWQARLQRTRGDLAGAADIYRALNMPSAEAPWTSVVEPRFVLERARLLSQNGDLQQARREYGRFLDLWRAADPRLPELVEARRQLKP